MIAIVWEFVVKAESIPAFQQAYGAGGGWAALFQRYPGYEGTTLLQDRATKTRFLTIDYWTDAELFDQMRQESQPEYARLDARFSELTESEREVGVFNRACD